MTLTLKPGAVKLKVCPVEMVLVTGSTVVGWSGVLLSLKAPVICSNDPEDATLSKGNWNVRSEAAATVFETLIGMECKKLGRKNNVRKRHTLKMISPEEIERVTLQKMVPVGVGRVLGRYSSPLFKLKSWNGFNDGNEIFERSAYLLDVVASRAINGAGTV